MRDHLHPTRRATTAATPVYRTLICALLLATAIWGSGGLPAAAGPVAAGSPSHLGGFHEVSATPWLDRGKPVVLFVGAQYCPFCAAERWALVMALSRFGRWSNLGTMHSTHGVGGFPSLPTYDLLHASYTSAAITLQEREVADFAGHPLQQLTPQQGHAVDAYDPHGGIPFQLLAGRYAQISSGYSPGLLVGLSFDRAHALIYQQPAGALSRAVTREADIISALICADLGAQAGTPAACRLPAVRSLLA